MGKQINWVLLDKEGQLGTSEQWGVLLPDNEGQNKSFHVEPTQKHIKHINLAPVKCRVPVDVEIYYGYGLWNRTEPSLTF